MGIRQNRQIQAMPNGGLRRYNDINEGKGADPTQAELDHIENKIFAAQDKMKSGISQI